MPVACAERRSFHTGTASNVMAGTGTPSVGMDSSLYNRQAMNTNQAIERLDDMQRQLVHESTVLKDIADVIR